MKVNTNPLDLRTEMDWTSSKGNQNKWFSDGIWYKEDGLGYEALTEIVVSRLMEKSNVNDYVKYEYEPLEKSGCVFRGCKSLNFLLPEDDKIISVERLFQTYQGESAVKSILQFAEIADRIQYVCDIVEKCTGLKNFGVYLKKIITLDALFLNEDRHFHNIAVILKKDGTYRECPVFDNGAGLFSDIKGDYPLGTDLQECYGKIQAKPFSFDFDEQLDACDILFGEFQFKAWFTIKDVEDILSGFREIYEERILNRVLEVMRIQMRKYSYLFTGR